MRTTMTATLGVMLSAATALAGSLPADGTAYHLYTAGPHLAPPNAGAGATMLYYGGPVIATVKVAVVIWGTGVAKSITHGIGGYYKAIVDSTYIDQLAQYSTHMTGVNGHAGTNQTITRGSYLGLFRITPSNTATKLSDGQVQTELKAQIAAGKLPPQDLNTLYMIYFPRRDTITLGKSASCSSFGAYHEATSSSVSPTNVFYGVMPDCGGGFTTITDVSAHEFAEAVSDAIPTPGSNPAYPQAWNTSNGSEIGDLCESSQGTLTAGASSYVVQEVFDNATNACGTGNFTSP